ncbi:hypothetical protein [Rhodococcus sp. ZPP]|uniref:hypothetical protein n=1 Tax=Rhodococcus sp. ZPP TaxID=2749906 RepID=UPI001FCE2A20|nr:hypothetical protein [Rhodococcus sp. ZPP]
MTIMSGSSCQCPRVGALHGDRRQPRVVGSAEELGQLRRKIAAIPARVRGQHHRGHGRFGGTWSLGDCSAVVPGVCAPVGLIPQRTLRWYSNGGDAAAGGELVPPLGIYGPTRVE